MAVSRKGKFIILGAIALLLIVSVVLGLVLTRKDLPEVTVAKIERRRELKQNVTASGEIRPIQFINLTSEVQGRIEEIFVKEGEAVKKGTALVRLDPTQLESSADAQFASLQASQSDVQVSRSQVTAAQNQYSQAQQGLIASQASVDTAIQQVTSARQNVVAAQTDVDRSQVELNAANRELNRSEELVEKGVISKLEYDTARDRVANAQVSLRNSQSRLKSAQLSVNEAELRVKESRARAQQQEVAVRDARRGVDTASLSAQSSEKRSQQQAAVFRGQRTQRDKTLQSAPIDGIIADIPSKVGTFAVANLSSTPLLTIADMSGINVEVKVDETQIDKVSEGQSAKVKVDAFGEREIAGKVILKNPLAIGKSQTSGGLSTNINTQEAKEFKVVIELTDIPAEMREGLRPGMSATAVITTNTSENLFAVPLTSVIEKKPEPAPSPTLQGDLQMPAEKPKAIKGVYVLEGNKVKFVEVETGITGDSDIEIKSGVSEGQEVITGPNRVLNTLKDGTVVKKQEKKEGENANK